MSEDNILQVWQMVGWNKRIIFWVVFLQGCCFGKLSFSALLPSPLVYSYFYSSGCSYSQGQCMDWMCCWYGVAFVVSVWLWRLSFCLCAWLRRPPTSTMTKSMTRLLMSSSRLSHKRLMLCAVFLCQRCPFCIRLYQITGRTLGLVQRPLKEERTVLHTGKCTGACQLTWSLLYASRAGNEFLDLETKFALLLYVLCHFITFFTCVGLIFAKHDWPFRVVPYMYCHENNSPRTIHPLISLPAMGVGICFQQVVVGAILIFFFLFEVLFLRLLFFLCFFACGICFSNMFCFSLTLCIRDCSQLPCPLKSDHKLSLVSVACVRGLPLLLACILYYCTQCKIIHLLSLPRWPEPSLSYYQQVSYAFFRFIFLLDVLYLKYIGFVLYARLFFTFSFLVEERVFLPVEVYLLFVLLPMLDCLNFFVKHTTVHIWRLSCCMDRILQ